MKINYILFCLAIFFSCKNEENATKDLIIPQTIVLKEVDNLVNLSEFISEIKYIPLKTTKESLIGEIINIKLYDGVFYILDRTGSKSSIKIFDKNGNFIDTFGSIGKGPKEIQNPRDIIKADDVMFVWDRKGIHSFSPNGSHLKFMFNAFLAGDRFFYEDGYFYFLHELNLPGLLSQYDIKGTLEHVFLPFDFGFGNSENSKVIKIKKSYHLFTPSIDTVYTFSENKLMLIYKIRFDGTSTFAKIITSHKQMNPYELLQLINKTDHGYISTYLENDNYLILAYWFNKTRNTVIINKKIWNHKYFTQFNNDIDGGIFGEPKLITQDNKLVIPLNSFDILEYIKGNHNAMIQDSPLHIISKNLDLTSNPVLMICKIKD